MSLECKGERGEVFTSNQLCAPHHAVLCGAPCGDNHRGPTIGRASETVPDVSLQDFDQAGEGWHDRVDSWNQRRIPVEKKQSRSFFPGGDSCHCRDGLPVSL